MFPFSWCLTCIFSRGWRRFLYGSGVGGGGECTVVPWLVNGLRCHLAHWASFTVGRVCWCCYVVTHHDDDEALVVGMEVVHEGWKIFPQLSVIGEDVLLEHRVDIRPLNVLSQTWNTITSSSSSSSSEVEKGEAEAEEDEELRRR